MANVVHLSPEAESTDFYALNLSKAKDWELGLLHDSLVRDRSYFVLLLTTK